MTFQHFTIDNTDGFSDEQLERANRLMDAWCYGAGIDPKRLADEPAAMGDFYKFECERVLVLVEVDQ